MGYRELQGSGEVISRHFGHNQLTQHPGPFLQLYERYMASVPPPIVRMTGGRFLGVWAQERQGDGVTSVGMWAQVNKNNLCGQPGLSLNLLSITQQASQLCLNLSTAKVQFTLAS